MSIATARAHPNIALVKYWGKRDEDLILPAAGSLSLTLDVFPTTTTVRLQDSADPPAQDVFTLNGAPADEKATARVSHLLDIVRDLAGTTARTHVDSISEIPVAAGLASSAAGFAALAVAAAGAYGLDLDTAALSRLARRGSGSASRSLIGGLAVWNAGQDDATSYAESVDGPDLAMVLLSLDRGQKPVSSREAMRRTAATSPYYDGWVSSTAATLEQALAACRDGDVARLGELTEISALRMHAAILACEPPIRYLTPASWAVFADIEQLRSEGVPVYGTADAGPNVVALTTPEHAELVSQRLEHHGAATISGAGPAATTVPTLAADATPAAAPTPPTAGGEA